MITVHHLERSRSHRILWLLEELDLEYQIETWKRHAKTQRAPAAMRDIHPLGKAPMVVLDDGTVLAESGAIVEALVERTTRLGPGDDSQAQVRYRFFMHYAEGSLMPPLLVKLILDKVRTAPLPFFVKPFAKAIANKVDAQYTNPELDLQIDFLDAELADREWFAGADFTAADVQMSYPVEASALRAGGHGSHRNLGAWLERVRARPAYQRALERGGPVML